MTTIAKGDFIEIDYTGQTVDDAVIFDTTEPSVAQKNDLDPHRAQGPLTICVGEGHILPSLDSKIEGSEVGKVYSYEFPPEEAFGKKNAKLLRLIPLSKFKDQQVMPHPLLQVNIDGAVGTVRSVNSGRVVVDFNHPLSGKDVKYTVKVLKKVDDAAAQVSALIRIIVGIPKPPVTVADGKATITLPFALPPDAQTSLAAEIKRQVPSLSDVTFIAEKQK